MPTLTQPASAALPDYTRLRREAGFCWSIGSGYSALLELTGINLRDFNLDPEAGIALFRDGRRQLSDMFGPVVATCNVHTPPISYGHVNGLGAALHFPDRGEVSHDHLLADASLTDAIRHLRRPVNYARAGMAPFYIEYRQALRRAFPEEAVGFSYGLEGPLTTAYELRGDALFYDPFDEPQLTRDFLQAVTASILDFHAFRCRLERVDPVNPDGAGMCDDIASMIPARMFPDYVLPFWDQYYQGRTTGARHAHVEDLRAEQLPFLERIGLSTFDPSISPKLNPRLITEACRVPFGWRLGSFHYPTLSCADIRDWVFQAVADGASKVFTHVAATMCTPETVCKVHAFAEAAQEAQTRLEDGMTREEIGALVSVAGRERFWNHWPD